MASSAHHKLPRHYHPTAMHPSIIDTCAMHKGGPICIILQICTVLCRIKHITKNWREQLNGLNLTFGLHSWFLFFFFLSLFLNLPVSVSISIPVCLNLCLSLNLNPNLNFNLCLSVCLSMICPLSDGICAVEFMPLNPIRMEIK